MNERSTPPKENTVPGETPSPQEFARSRNLPHQQALLNIDLRDPTLQVIGGDPVDLAGIDTQPVITLATHRTSVTVLAHQGEAQDVANLLHRRPDIKKLIVHYAHSFLDEGVMTFAMNALTDRQMRNIEMRTGRPLSGQDPAEHPRPGR